VIYFRDNHIPHPDKIKIPAHQSRLIATLAGYFTPQTKPKETEKAHPLDA